MEPSTEQMLADAFNAGRAYERMKITDMIESTPADDRASQAVQMPIWKLGLSERPRFTLLRNEINLVGQLLIMTEEDLLQIQHFGQKSLDEVKEMLAMYGLHLKPS